MNRGQLITYKQHLTVQTNPATSPFLWKDWGKRIPKHSMTKETADSILRFIRRQTFENNYEEITIDFIGLGEPLLTISTIGYIVNELHPFVTENRIRLGINIVSNGTLISSEFLSHLSKNDVYFQITLDGPKDVHNKRRMYKGGAGTYEKIIDGLKLLQDFKIPFAIRVNLDKDNYEYFGMLLDDLRVKLGIGLYIKLFPVLPEAKADHGWSKSCLVNRDLTIIPKLWELASQKGFIVPLGHLINFLPCKALADHSYIIDPVGDVYKCEGFAGNEEFRIATISSKGALSRLSRPFYEWMALDPIESGDCRDCRLLPACGGECPQLSYYYRGICNLNSCAKNKDFIIQSIMFKLNRIYPDLF